MRETLQKHARIFIAGADFLFCALSFCAMKLLGVSIVSVILCSFLLLFSQALIIAVLPREEGAKTLFLKHWPALLTCLASAVLSLFVLIMCLRAEESAGAYSQYGAGLCICLLYLSLAFGAMCIQDDTGLEKLFVPQAAVFGLVLSMVFPLNTIADEPQHMRTAYNVSNIMMGIESPKGAVTMRADDADYDFPYTVYSINDFSRYLAELSEPLGDDTLIPVYEEEYDAQSLDYARRPSVFTTEKYQYIPSALGMTLARLFHMNTIHMYLMGRLFNLLFYILVMYFALKLIPVGKSVLYTAALFPMSLQLAGSLSRDVFRISAAVLAVTLTLYLFCTDEEEIRHKKAVIAALAVTCIALFPLRSYVYSMFAVLPVLILLYRKKWITDKRICIFIAVCAALFITAIIAKYVFFPGDIVAEPEIPLSWMDENRYTKEVFINHPLYLITFLWDTLWTRGDYYVRTMIGYQLGWLDINLPDLLIDLFLVLLVISAAQRTYEKKTLAPVLRFTLFVFSAVSAVLIVLGITLTWTPVTSPTAMGVQGRYFLPIVLPLLLAFRGPSFQANEKCDAVCACIQFIALIGVSSLMIVRLL